MRHLFKCLCSSRVSGNRHKRIITKTFAVEAKAKKKKQIQKFINKLYYNNNNSNDNKNNNNISNENNSNIIF